VLRDIKWARHTAQYYNEFTSEVVKEEIEMAELKIQGEKELVLESQRIEEFENWILDPESTRGWLSLFNHSVDLYWFVKALLGKTLIERGEAYSDILRKLEKVYSALVHLKAIPYHLKVIEAKHALLASFVGGGI